MKGIRLTLVVLLAPLMVFAQEAPTGAHYAGRASDTGRGGSFVNAAGTFPASVPLDLPGARGGLPVPLQVVYGGRGVGAAGLNWDIPLSYILRDRTLAHRRPAFSSVYQLPSMRERAYLSLMGQRTELIFDGQAWVARIGTLELNVRDGGSSWIVYDGNGRIYTFMQPTQLANTGLWLLKFVHEPGGNKLELTYRLNTWAIEGGTGTEINLINIAYNRYLGFSSGECFKNEVALTYGNISQKPYSMSLFGEKVLTRNSTLTQIDVQSRATCSDPLQRLRRYVFDYPTPDPDTRLPRLRQVRMLGRQGTTEENSALPIVSFDYGAATTDGKLKYNHSQTVMLPADDPGSASHISDTQTDSNVVAPGSGEKYASWHSLTDVTGDGRPDIVFKKNDKLWMARNRPAPNGLTTVGNPTTAQLHDLTFKKGGIASHTTTKRRLWWGSANSNTVNVWRQAIDVNGDGRLDIIDAGEKTEHWVIYLNTPGTSSFVQWRRSEWNVKSLGLELASRGHKIEGGFVPLARRTTGISVTTLMCLTNDNNVWNPYDGTLVHTTQGEHGPVTVTYKCAKGRLTSAPAPPPCTGQMCPPPKSDQAERTFTEWEIQDLNGDGYPDFVFNQLPVEESPQPSLTQPIAIATASSGQFVRIGEARLTFQLPLTSSMTAAFNLAGTRWGTETYPFAKSI
ncbi:MAG TPA: VCBS repeat-containing protein, partial [Pyrinomonadaceae bacterium]|nr:VCBS repeat-containing protein [Pyrinomonadaceae bacterium]